MSITTISDANNPPATRPSKRRRYVWIRRIVLGFFVILAALIVVGLVYQAFGAQSDQRRFPPPGQLVDVGGYQLHIYCTGPLDSGNPTVILETLSGGVSSYWAWVQPEISKVTHVCSYDRAGRGWSEPSTQPMTLQHTVIDLHSLLQNAGIPGPYVLVGHSIGGMYVRKYAADFPGEVEGVVLVDSAHPFQFVRYPEMLAQNESYLQMSAMFPPLARIGLFRFYFSLGGEIDFADLPDRQHDEVAAFWSSPEYFISQRAEASAGAAIFSDAQSLGSLGELPLAVISQGANPPPGWADMQAELSALSTNSIHITVPEATHASLAFHPEHAHETSLAVLQVVEAARTGQPLSSK